MNPSFPSLKTSWMAHQDVPTWSIESMDMKNLLANITALLRSHHKLDEFSNMAITIFMFMDTHKYTLTGPQMFTILSSNAEHARTQCSML